MGNFKNPLNITSIRIMRTASNLENLIGALTVFDNIISGEQHYEPLSSSIKYDTLAALMGYFVHNKLEKKLNEYIYKTFDCFRKNKRKIIINLSLLNNITGKHLVSPYMHDMTKTDCKEFIYRPESDMTNLFKPDLLRFLNHLTHITIDSQSLRGQYEFIISLLGLLSIIKYSTIQEITILGGKKGGWLSKLWSSDNRDEIVNKYQNNGFKIAVEKNHKLEGKDAREQLIIERQ